MVMSIIRGALSALTVLALTTGGPGPAAAVAATAPAAVTVHIVNFSFKPSVVTIAAGTTITFVNDDTEPHTVTAVDKSFDSEGLDLHQSWKHAFNKVGSYAYFCEMHPYMKGKIFVTAGGK
jgi:plastocyanin